MIPGCCPGGQTANSALRQELDDVTTEDPELAPNEILSTDASVMPREASTSWDPHEVWLTRVKRPRDRAALELRDDAERRGPEGASGDTVLDAGPRASARLSR